MVLYLEIVKVGRKLSFYKFFINLNSHIKVIVKKYSKNQRKKILLEIKPSQNIEEIDILIDVLINEIKNNIIKTNLAT